MTRVFLAAGVAALAIAAPANAGPHGGGGGGKDRQATFANHGGGGGGGGQHAQPRERGGGGGGYAAPRMQRQSFAQPRMQRQERFAAVERHQHSQPMQMRAERQQHVQMRAERQQPRQQPHVRMVERQQSRHQAQTRIAERQQVRTNRQQAQTRVAEREQVRQNRLEAQNRFAERQQTRGNRANLVQNRMAERQQLQANRMNQAQTRMAERQQIRGQRQMASSNLLAERHALRADRIANADLFRTSRFARTLETNPRMRFVAPSDAVRFVGEPVRNVTNFVGLSALPASVSYLYPDTPDYYYQYGGGYLYQVDRSSSLINALIPLLAGGYLPGTYLPQPYMSSYVPSYYGLNSFYPASYGAGYGYGYPNLCNRYAYGVVYQVDCYTGMVVNVIPTYAGGYGVGQMLPSAYSYYNVPMQYRSLYYPTADYSYWYAPGAIYQYDTNSSLITSVAALMSPGFSIGQPLPTGYGMYNVPMAYRSTYYDTPNAWYRYNNGYIYQVDPSTMLVTATVASLLS